jgi:ATP-dependent DNA ligase
LLRQPYVAAIMALLRERTRPGLEFIEPCLPSSAKAPPSGPGWIHEIKHDGFRIMARRDGLVRAALLLEDSGLDYRQPLGLTWP